LALNNQFVEAHTEETIHFKTVTQKMMDCVFQRDQDDARANAKP
jgi:hypothetical protein